MEYYTKKLILSSVDTYYVYIDRGSGRFYFSSGIDSLNVPEATEAIQGKLEP